MNEERIKRYRDKLNIMLKRAEQIDEWTKNIKVKEFIKDEKTKLAVYKAFQEIVESCMDIISMLCKDLKISPKDDYTNIENIGRKIKDIDEELLKEANGLRNVIVHRYNATDDARAFKEIKRITPEMIKFVKVVEKWIKERIS